VSITGRRVRSHPMASIPAATDSVARPWKKETFGQADHIIMLAQAGMQPTLMGSCRRSLFLHVTTATTARTAASPRWDSVPEDHPSPCIRILDETGGFRAGRSWPDRQPHPLTAPGRPCKTVDRLQATTDCSCHRPKGARLRVHEPLSDSPHHGRHHPGPAVQGKSGRRRPPIHWVYRRIPVFAWLVEHGSTASLSTTFFPLGFAKALQGLVCASPAQWPKIGAASHPWVASTGPPCCPRIRTRSPISWRPPHSSHATACDRVVATPAMRPALMIEPRRTAALPLQLIATVRLRVLCSALQALSETPDGGTAGGNEFNVRCCRPPPNRTRWHRASVCQVQQCIPSCACSSPPRR